MLRHRGTYRLPAVVLAFVLAGCATTGNQPNVLGLAQEQELGAQLAAQVEQQEQVLDDAAMQAYIDRIGERLARTVERRDVTYHFTVIDDPDNVNAFALPGGHMYLYTGLLKLASSEAELASVMAHELAHVSSYHHGESLTRQYGYSLIASALLGDGSAAAANLAAQFIGASGQMYYSRNAEREADAKGMDYLFRAGYRPEAMVTFMEKLARLNEERPRGFFYTMLSSHPATDERVATLVQLVQRYPFAQRRTNQTYAGRYRAEVLSKL